MTDAPIHVPLLPWKRLGLGMNLALLALGLVVIVGVVNFFSLRDEYRVRVDATTTRAYSLSEQTTRLLHSLTGDWSIAVLASSQSTDRNIRRQVDEVLDRFREASPRIAVQQIDPTDPRDLRRYENLLNQLRALYAPQMVAYDRSIEAGLRESEALAILTESVASRIAQAGAVREQLAAPLRDELQQVLSVLTLRREQVTQVAREVEKSRAVSDSRPLPDDETARSILVAALSNWANDLAEVSSVFNRWLQQADFPTSLRVIVSPERPAIDALARRLALAADDLKRLPPTELASIGRQLEQGEAALIIGPGRATIVPAQQLFPATNFRSTQEGGVKFDRRFRGEQVLAAAMRSLVEKQMPLVVFIHAQDTPLLRRRTEQADLIGVGTMFESSRFALAEWPIGQNASRPSPIQDQPAVWVVIPPIIPERQGIAPSEKELRLVETVRKLIADGENVLLSVTPSLMPRFRQKDPWSAVFDELQIDADTAHVIFESVRSAEGRSTKQRVTQLSAYGPSHAIGRALEGQPAIFPMPVPIKLRDDAIPGVSIDVIASIAPSASHWLEDNWAVDPATLPDPEPAKRFFSDLPIAVALDRPHPIERKRQRVVIVGSGEWMLTRHADVAVRLGGERAALVYPGNHEFMLASAAWLAHMDDLIAQSPVARQVSRLVGVTDAVRTRWFWIVAAGIPAGILLLGIAVWMYRRLSA